MEHKEKRRTEHLSMRLDSELNERLNKALAGMRIKAAKHHGTVTKTSVIEDAIDCYLTVLEKR